MLHPAGVRFRSFRIYACRDEPFHEKAVAFIYCCGNLFS